MIWIGIIIGLVIGYFIGLSEVKRLCKSHSLFIMSEDDCNKNATRLSSFLEKRYPVCVIPSLDDEVKEWKETQGKRIREELFDQQDCTGEFGSWWLPNFIRFVDSVQCRIIIADKEKPDEYVATEYRRKRFSEPPTEPRSH